MNRLGGEWMNGEYRKALQVSRLSREQVAQVCVDLKRRIQGEFYVIEEDEDKIVSVTRPAHSRKSSRTGIHVHDDFQRLWPYRR